MDESTFRERLMIMWAKRPLVLIPADVSNWLKEAHQIIQSEYGHLTVKLTIDEALTLLSLTTLQAAEALVAILQVQIGNLILDGFMETDPGFESPGPWPNDPTGGLLNGVTHAHEYLFNRWAKEKKYVATMEGINQDLLEYLMEIIAVDLPQFDGLSHPYEYVYLRDNIMGKLQVIEKFALKTLPKTAAVFDELAKLKEDCTRRYAGCVLRDK